MRCAALGVQIPQSWLNAPPAPPSCRTAADAGERCRPQRDSAMAAIVNNTVDLPSISAGKQTIVRDTTARDRVVAGQLLNATRGDNYVTDSPDCDTSGTSRIGVPVRCTIPAPNDAPFVG